MVHPLSSRTADSTRNGTRASRSAGDRPARDDPVSDPRHPAALGRRHPFLGAVRGGPDEGAVGVAPGVRPVELDAGGIRRPPSRSRDQRRGSNVPGMVCRVWSWRRSSMSAITPTPTSSASRSTGGKERKSSSVSGTWAPAISSPGRRPEPGPCAPRAARSEPRPRRGVERDALLAARARDLP